MRWVNKKVLHICGSGGVTESAGVFHSSFPPGWPPYWSPSVSQSRFSPPLSARRWIPACSPALSCNATLQTSHKHWNTPPVFAQVWYNLLVRLIYWTHLKNQLGSPLYVPSSFVTAKLPRAERVLCTAARSLPVPGHTVWVRGVQSLSPMATTLHVLLVYLLLHTWFSDWINSSSSAEANESPIHSNQVFGVEKL